MRSNHNEPLVQALLRATDYGVLVTDPRGNDIFCNPRFEALFGVSAAEVVGLPREEVRGLALERVQDPAAFSAMVEMAYANPLLEFQDEVALSHPQAKILRRHSAPIFDDGSVVIGRVWTFLDVTETRQLQQKVASYARQLEERLAQQAGELRAAQERLLEAAQMRAVGTLAMGVAHDLRNILTTLRLEMAAYEVPCGSMLEGQLDRLYAITHYLLALSDEKHTHAGQVDLGEIIDFVFELVRGQAEVDGVCLVKQSPEGIAPVYGNARRLEHLFVNLLLNAMNAVAPTGGEVTVRLAADGDRVRIDVQDNGPGIPEQYRERLFEPFFTTRANRVGLGLFSARKIVEAHRGEIQVGSEPGKGARVTVWLPTSEKPDETGMAYRYESEETR